MTSAPPTLTRPHGAVPGDRLLRPALQVDAAITGLNGAAYLVAAPVLEDVLGLPAGPLRAVGAFLLAFAAAVWTVGSRTTIRTGPGVTVVIVNLLWVAASLAVAVSGWHTPTAVGTVWIVAQATVVAAFAVLQWRGLRSRTDA